MRGAASTVVLDSMTQFSNRGRTDMVKRAGAHTFVLRDSIWTDVTYKPNASVKTIRIKAFSKAYFDLINALPELRSVFAVGEKVTVQGRSVAVVVSESGVEELSSSEVKGVVAAW